MSDPQWKQETDALRTHLKALQGRPVALTLAIGTGWPVTVHGTVRKGRWYWSGLVVPLDDGEDTLYVLIRSIRYIRALGVADASAGADRATENDT